MKLRDLSAPKIIAAICVVVFIIIVLAAIPAAAQVMDGLNTAAQNNAVGILDLLIKVAVFVISLIVGLATSKLPAKWRRETEAALAAKEEKLRDALHQAARSGIEDGARQGLTGMELILHGMKHVVQSTPDSIVELTPTPAEVLKGAAPAIILDRLPQGVRDTIERIVRSKVADPLADALREAIK